MSTKTNLGEATTVGELRAMLEGYHDDVPFGFYQQPMQQLHEIIITGRVFVCFMEPPPDCRLPIMFPPIKKNHK